MNPALIQIMIAGINFASEFMKSYPAIRLAASTEDRATLDALYAQFRETSNAVADRLRATPDDAV